MQLQTAGDVVAKKRVGRPKTGQVNATAKIDSEILGWAKYVSGRRKQTIPEYLNQILRPIVERDVKAESERLVASLTKKPK